MGRDDRWKVRVRGGKRWEVNREGGGNVSIGEKIKHITCNMETLRTF